PKTKYRLKRYQTSTYEDEPKVYDMILEYDNVEEYPGCPDICCHRLNLIEASAIAQGMHVDNISLTYELQDVTLNYKTYTTDNTPVYVDATNGGYNTPIRQTLYTDDAPFGSGTSSRYGYFKNSYAYIWDENSFEAIESLMQNLEIAQDHTISFNIPKLYCYGTSNSSTWDKLLFQMNTIIKVYKYQTVNKVIQQNTRTLITTSYDGPSSITTANNEWYYSDGVTAALRTIDTTVVESGNVVTYPNITTEFSDGYTTAPIVAQVNSSSNGICSFNVSHLDQSDIENGYGYHYVLEIAAHPVNATGMLTFYKTSFFALSSISTYIYTGFFYETAQEVQEASAVVALTTFEIYDMSKNTEFGPLITKGKRYYCYDLLKKALLTIDTQILNNLEKGIDDINYQIIIDDTWLNRLKTAKMFETILEEKNLWEILIQIGYYLHAIPYLSFANDGTDRFILSFKQLGGTFEKNNKSTKITVFNSQNLNNYFSQYDTYVTNLFSPQNKVEEWLVCKTDDESALVSNNTAILKTTKGISEIIEFDITYDGSAGGVTGTKSALEHIFELSIYKILTADYNITPSKGSSIYYTLGENVISGVNYVPPSENSDMPMSLKRIVGILFSGVVVSNLKFNNLKFHIKYRTQDSLRISQIRPNLRQFLKNSSYEYYPHHEQFYGQEDKIVDSERLSLNLFGKLIKVGNNIYQLQEYVKYGEEKESGDLVKIGNEPYYVTEVENEFYMDAIFQKVTYSKDFNQLSQIVTIPSEPRFYEVSERSKIRREIRLFDFLVLSTISNTCNTTPRFLGSNWKNFVSCLIFNLSTAILPNYAWSSFIGDSQRIHKGYYNQYIALTELFPSSELDRTDENNIYPKNSNSHSDCIVPLLHFPIKDGINFEW
ncbi:MAG: hypothetical protein WCR27_10210, partial [Eubacteriales bacterium]